MSSGNISVMSPPGVTEHGKDRSYRKQKKESMKDGKYRKYNKGSSDSNDASSPLNLNFLKKNCTDDHCGGCSNSHMKNMEYTQHHNHPSSAEIENKFLNNLNNNNIDNEVNVEKKPGCTCCGEEIVDGTPFIIDKDGYNYHKECFNCTHCNKNISDGQYKSSSDGSGPVCLECALPQCAECLNLIVGDLIVATHVDGTKYAFHTQCLKCIDCGHHIHGKYTATEYGFKCEECDSVKCGLCRSMIPGGSQYYLDKNTNEPQCNNCYRNVCLMKNNVNNLPGTSSTTTIHLMQPTPICTPVYVK